MRVMKNPPSRKKQYLKQLRIFGEKAWDKMSDSDKKAARLRNRAMTTKESFLNGIKELYLYFIYPVFPTREWQDWAIKKLFIYLTNELPLRDSGFNTWNAIENRFETLQHVFSTARINNIHSIISLPSVRDGEKRLIDKLTVNGVIDLLVELETRWLAENEALDKSRFVKSGKPVLDCGDDWYWYLLNDSYCEATGRAMGHCGNEGSRDPAGDNVLNLGKKHKDGYFVHLTFILNHGVLGEMKGYGNSKPAPKYHPQIVKLLLSDLVTYVDGGGYSAKNNFEFKDLPTDLAAHLMKVKPELHDPAFIHKKGPDAWSDFIHGTLHIYDDDAIDFWHKHGPFVDSGSAMEFVQTYWGKNSQMYRIGKLLQNFSYEHYFYDGVTPQDVQLILNRLSAREISKLKKLVKKEFEGLKESERKAIFDYPDQVDILALDEEELSDLILDIDKEVAVAASQAIRSAWESGTTTALRARWAGYLVEGLEHDGDYAVFTEDHEIHPDSELKLFIPNQKLIQIYRAKSTAEDFSLEDYQVNIDTTMGDKRNDFDAVDEFDEDQAITEFKELTGI